LDIRGWLKSWSFPFLGAPLPFRGEGSLILLLRLFLLLLLLLLGPHKAVAVEPAERPARVKHMDVRVF